MTSKLEKLVPTQMTLKPQFLHDSDNFKTFWKFSVYLNVSTIFKITHMPLAILKSLLKIFNYVFGVDGIFKII